MVDIASVVFILFAIGVMFYALFHGCSININVTLKQEFSPEDRELLEDLYNQSGDLKREDDVMESFDKAVQALNNIMLDNEEESNG